MTIQIFKGVQNQELVLKADYDNAERDAQIGLELSERLERQLREKQADYDKLAAERDALLICAKNMALALDQDSEEPYPFWQNDVAAIESGNTAVIINDFKAQGVDEFGEFWQKNCDGESFIAAQARKYADDLRAGVKP